MQLDRLTHCDAPIVGGPWRTWVRIGVRVSVVVGLVAIVGVTGRNLWAQDGTAPPATTAKLMVVYYARLSPAEMKQLPTDFVSKVREVGWLKVGDKFIKAVPMPDTELVAGTVVVRTDADGVFSPPSNATETGLELMGGSKTVSLTPPGGSEVSVLVGQGQGIEVWTLELPRKSCCPAPTGQVRIQYEGEGRCLDYNGWYSDGRNYPISDWRAWRNFVMSDCDRVAWRCAKEHAGLVNGCYENHGGKGCSTYINHSPVYHKHNWPN